MFKEGGGRGLTSHEACLKHVVSDISVAPEVFIVQRKNETPEQRRIKSTAARKRGSLREQTLHTSINKSLSELVSLCISVCVCV